jgi:hypothetical protein
MIHPFRRVAFLAFALLPAFAPARACGGAEPADPLELTAAERTLVRDLSEQALKERGLLKGKVYLTRVEVFAGSAAPARHALVQHYCYDGDRTVLTAVSLEDKKVTGVEVLPHFPTPLTSEELEHAEKLARAHPVVKRALARQKGEVEVDALLTFTSVPDAPTYNHRVVRLFFRQGRTYLLYGPAVEVDLTTETVRAERTDKAHN